MAKRMQYCDGCGEELGVYEHSQRWDGPQSCGKAECNRECSDAVRAEREEAAYRAERDDYDRYRW